MHVPIEKVGPQLAPMAPLDMLPQRKLMGGRRMATMRMQHRHRQLGSHPQQRQNQSPMRPLPRNLEECSRHVDQAPAGTTRAFNQPLNRQYTGFCDRRQFDSGIPPPRSRAPPAPSDRILLNRSMVDGLASNGHRVPFSPTLTPLTLQTTARQELVSPVRSLPAQYDLLLSLAGPPVWLPPRSPRFS